METEKPTIIFVYNADSGVFNLLGDMAHKIFSPQTYACNLCAITHGNFGMREEWREYLKTLEFPFEFLHADEFRKKYNSASAELPAVFSHQNGSVKEIISAQRINQCRSIENLKSLIDSTFNRNSD